MVHWECYRLKLAKYLIINEPLKFILWQLNGI